MLLEKHSSFWRNAFFGGRAYFCSAYCKYKGLCANPTF